MLYTTTITLSLSVVVGIPCSHAALLTSVPNLPTFNAAVICPLFLFHET